MGRNKSVVLTEAELGDKGRFKAELQELMMVSYVLFNICFQK